MSRDVYCPKCNEPFEQDYFHDIAEENGTDYATVSRDFQKRGCEAMNEPHGDGPANPYAEALFDLLGDDIDGTVNMMEDYPEFFQNL